MSSISAGTTSTTTLIHSGDTTGSLVFKTNDTGSGGTTAVTIDTSQNVGIGTTPRAKLEISKSSDSASPSRTPADYSILFTAAQSNTYNNGIGVTEGTYVNSAITPIDTGSGGAQGWSFITGNNTAIAEAMRIDSSGNLLVGTTSVAASCKTTISTSNDNQLAINCATASGTVYSSIIFSQAGTNKTQLYQDHGATRFYVTNVSAGVYLASGGTSWTAASDERVKDIIEPIDNATTKLANWRTVIGKYKTDEEGTRRSFLIAQDVFATFPEAVDASDANEYGVRYQDTIPLLVAAIKEQQALITAQAETINALTARVVALEGK